MSVEEMRGMHGTAGSTVIAHRDTCPVAQPGFRLPVNPDGTVKEGTRLCNCDFKERLQEAMGRVGF